MSAVEILTAHELKMEIRRVPNGRPVTDWSCTCPGVTFGSDLHDEYLLHLIRVAQEAALSRDALVASILAVQTFPPRTRIVAEMLADQILADAGVTE
jgi:hypothetical protein